MIPPRDAEVISHSCDRDAYHIDCAADIENISAERRTVAGKSTATVRKEGKRGLCCLSEKRDSMIGQGSFTRSTLCYFQKRTWLKHLVDSSFRKDRLKWHQE